MAKIKIKDTEVTVVKVANADYICLTDMIKAKDGDFFVADWLRNRNTLEYIGIWEQVNNPDFNYGEFATIRNKSGLNNFKISICLANMENLNAVFINEKIPQQERLIRLNKIAIQQMKILQEVENRKILR